MLVGHSMGGKTAQLLAARRPKGLRGLVLVAPAPPAPVGVTPETRETLAHAYDDASTVGAIPRAELVELSDTGHLSPLEVPDQVAAHLTEFTTHLTH